MFERGILLKARLLMGGAFYTCVLNLTYLSQAIIARKTCTTRENQICAGLGIPFLLHVG